jgi:hypothetical protein
MLEVNSCPLHQQVLPLIEKLDLITDPKRWGYPFFGGHLEISPIDFALIASNMGFQAHCFGSNQNQNTL